MKTVLPASAAGSQATGFGPVADFLALQTVVVALVAIRASEVEAAGGVAQAFINDLSALCQEAILSSDVGLSSGGSSADFRQLASDHVSRILSLARFAQTRADTPEAAPPPLGSPQ